MIANVDVDDVDAAVFGIYVVVVVNVHVNDVDVVMLVAFCVL